MRKSSGTVFDEDGQNITNARSTKSIRYVYNHEIETVLMEPCLHFFLVLFFVRYVFHALYMVLKWISVLFLNQGCTWLSCHFRMKFQSKLPEFSARQEIKMRQILLRNVLPWKKRKRQFWKHHQHIVNRLNQSNLDIQSWSSQLIVILWSVIKRVLAKGQTNLILTISILEFTHLTDIKATIPACSHPPGNSCLVPTLQETVASCRTHATAIRARSARRTRNCVARIRESEMVVLVQAPESYPSIQRRSRGPPTESTRKIICRS